MLGKFSRIPIITLLAIVLLVTACTASEPKIWSITGSEGDLGWWITMDIHNIDSPGEPFTVQSFGFNLTYPAGTYSGLELLGPYGPTPPPQIPSPSSTGGIMWVEGIARPGEPLPEGLGGNVDLARFHVDSFFDVFTELTVSGGYVTLGDGTRDDNIESVTRSFVVPEPSSVAALLTGVVGLAGFGIRRRKTS
ncbi:MAG: hypothetical protein A2Z18_01565 [Armatimonadetes bacterium RBG_16_58_9]|nr:MAG: hypothetical protein A2Z18_01565 [Armatimonadetes bacterium RBG_16_58_9]